jgi:hypothetical protein
MAIIAYKQGGARVLSQDEESALRRAPIVQLAEAAFDAEERLRIAMQNTPTDYEGRKKAYVEMAVLRERAIRAQAELDAEIEAAGRISSPLRVRPSVD